MKTKERPILFSARMIRAILDGTKRVTRRPLKIDVKDVVAKSETNVYVACPFGQPGDRLWVRETWGVHPDDGGYLYRATDPGWDDEDTGLLWRPNIHMPREACRLVLEITDVRAERLQKMTQQDAILEGYVAGVRPFSTDGPPKHRFMESWDKIYKERGYGWDLNPYCWVISFRRMT